VLLVSIKGSVPKAICRLAIRHYGVIIQKLRLLLPRLLIATGTSKNGADVQTIFESLLRSEQVKEKGDSYQQTSALEKNAIILY
jgi:hypothetical protein